MAELESKLDAVRREVRNLVVMRMDPNQTPDQLTIIKHTARRSSAIGERIDRAALSE